METITAEQIRAGRALVRITAQELADAARIGVATVRRCEAETGPVSATRANVAAILAAFHAYRVGFSADSGVYLIPEDDEEKETEPA